MKIVVIVIDALRADSLSCYGCPRETSPALDRLAGEGVLFENAYAQANWTNPSLYSFVTGLYPSRHGVEDFDQNLGEKVSTLPGFLSGAGYRTALFSNYHVLLDRARLGRHFQETRYFDIDRDGETLRRTVAAGGESDLFLMLHVGNYVHEPYCADPREVGRFWEGDFPRRKIIRALTEEAGLDDESMRDVLRSINLRRQRLSRKELAFLKACYDAGIRHVDGRLQVFFDFLASLPEEVILVVTADHGQGFMEHGFFGHGLNLNQELVRVPLIFWRNRAPGGMRINSTVQLIDLFPTLLDLLGCPGSPAMDGCSFAGCLRGVEDGSRRAVCEGNPFAAGVSGGKKLIVSRYRLLEAPERTARLAELLRRRRFRRFLLHLYSIFRAGLYDLAADPGERHNLKRRDPAGFKKMLNDLKAWQREVSSSIPEVTTRKLEDKKTIEQLKSLGYL